MDKMRLRALGAWLLVLALAPAARAGVDTDGDGLSDDRETVTYGTDPAKKDSDGDGKPDGDPNERREYAYSIRSVVRVMRPVAAAEALVDDHQDVRVVAQTEQYVDLEVVTYPFAKVREAMRPAEAPAEEVAPFLAAGVTTNWDAQLAETLRTELAAAGIEAKRPLDPDTVHRIAGWLLKRATCIDKMFCTYYVDFPTEGPRVLPGTESRFPQDKGDPSWSVADQFAHELFGRSMYEKRTYGTCTSAATYLATGLRALGVPTRMILTIPVADASDPAQLGLVAAGLREEPVRRVVLTGLDPGNVYFTAHTLDEVFVGGRWVRLNYSDVADGVLNPRYLGLGLKVNVFRDLSEARLAPTWGLRYASGKRDETFPNANPYRLLEIEDRMGSHAKRPLPIPEPRLHDRLTVTSVYWADDDALPAWLTAARYQKAEPGSGKFLLEEKEWFEEQGYEQLKRFMRTADGEFTLESKGKPDVRARLTYSYKTGGTPPRGAFEVQIDKDDLAKLKPGTTYTVVPRNKSSVATWVVDKKVKLATPARR